MKLFAVVNSNDDRRYLGNCIMIEQEREIVSGACASKLNQI